MPKIDAALAAIIDVCGDGDGRRDGSLGLRFRRGFRFHASRQAIISALKMISDGHYGMSDGLLSQDFASAGLRRGAALDDDVDFA